MQRSIISELVKIATVHLFTLGYRGNDLLCFKLALNNPSKLAELQELEHWKSRFEAADAASAGYFSRRWVAKNILNVNEEEYQRMQTEMYYDKKQDAMLEQVAEAMAAGAAPPADAGMGPPPGGDMGGEMDMDMGGDAAGEEGAEEEAGPLLATPGEEAPAKKDDGTSFKTFKTDKYGRVLTTTDRSKGKWYKEDPGPDRRNGLAQSQKAWAGMQNVGKTKRSFLPGAKEIGINYSLSEGTNPNYYDEEEKQILKNTADISRLIESLEKAEDETKPQ